MRDNQEPLLEDGKDECKSESLLVQMWERAPIRILSCFMLFEYLCVVPLHYLATSSFSVLADLVPLAFACASMLLQAQAFTSGQYEDAYEPWKQAYRCEENHKVKQVELCCGVVVHLPGIKTWVWDLVALGPNAAHILSTVLAAAHASKVWVEQDLQLLFERRWHDVPLIGQWIGQQGLPQLLEIVIGLKIMFHLEEFYDHVFQSRPLASSCEAANFLVLEQFLHRSGAARIESDIEGRGHSRAVVCLVTTPALLWLKVSLLAMTYESLNSSGFFSVVLAIGMSYYAVVPMLPYIAARSVPYLGLASPIAFKLSAIPVFWLPMFITATHLVGVFHCPSHDFSVMHMSCTAA